MQIAGSTTVITGGASGLGRATAERLHGGGGAVVLLDLAKSPGAQVAAALGERALFAPADVTNPDEVVAALEAAVARFGAVHALVNCAGIGTADKTFGKRGPADLGGFARTIQVNLIGTFNCIRLAAAQMAKNVPNLEGERGVVINTASWPNWASGS
jgi:NAD(P)-dependent dehydrogenase (short-subunit alcohol dehydrogenase family)